MNPQALEGFNNEVGRQKVALVQALGRLAVRGGMAAAKKLGRGSAAKGLLGKGIRAAGGNTNLHKAVGAGTLALGGAGAVGAGVGRATKG